MPHKAIILAAGLGTRMRAYCPDLPKPLVSVAGRALIDWTLNTLREGGIEECVVNLYHMADKLEAHLRARVQGPEILFSPEKELLETGGGIANALPLLGTQPFFSLNSDAIVRNAVGKSYLKTMAEKWDDASIDALLLVVPKENAKGYEGKGDFHLDAQGRLRRRQENEEAPYVFTGAQLLHPRFFANAPVGAFSMNKLYNRAVEADGTLDARIRGIIHEGAWLHVGDANGVKLAEAHLQSEAA